MSEKKIKGTSVVFINEEKVIPGIKLKITAENADKKLF